MREKQLSRSLTLTSLITLSLLGILTTNVHAENQSIYTSKKNLVTFEPPQGNKPLQTTGGASRGQQCPSNAQDIDLGMTPLLPSASPALTVKSHPTLLVYIPEVSARKVVFSIRDQNEDYDYQTILPIGESAGIVNFTLPEQAPDLSIDREYQWSLILMCDGKLRPDSPISTGTIKRVASDTSMTQKLHQANLLESAVIYGQAGIWYDTAATLAQLKIAQPDNQNISENWKSLLKNVGLEKVAQAKFVE